jgi:hypothetical protein
MAIELAFGLGFLACRYRFAFRAGNAIFGRWLSIAANLGSGARLGLNERCNIFT